MKLAPRIGSAVFLAFLLLALAAAISFAQPSFPPAAPSDLYATAVGATRVDLTWKDNASGASNETRFEIERSTGGTYNFVKIGESAQDATSYIDQSPLSGTLYYYQVRACNAVGCSGYSNVASAQTGTGMTGPSQAPPGGSGAITAVVDPEVPVLGSYLGIGTANPPERFTLLDGSLFQGYPLLPRVVGGQSVTGLNPAKDTENLFIAGNYLYIAFEYPPLPPDYLPHPKDALRIIDISNPANPGVVGDAGDLDLTCCIAKGVFVSGRYAYIIFQTEVTRFDTLRIFDISNANSPKMVGGAGVVISPNQASPFGLFVSGDYLYTTFQNGQSWDKAFRVVDISDPVNPVVVGGDELNLQPCFANGYGQVRAIQVFGRYAYIAINNPNYPFAVIDVSDPTNPVCKNGGSLDQPLPAGVGARSVAVAGRYAYLGLYDSSGIPSPQNALRIIDISSPVSPKIVAGSGNIAGDMPGVTARTVHISGRYLFLTFNNPLNNPGQALRIIDVLDPATPKVVGGEQLINNMPTNSAAAGVEVVGRYAYLSFNGPGSGETSEVFRVIDVSGLESVSASIHSLEADSLQILTNATIYDNLDMRGGLTVGTQAFLNGKVAVYGNVDVRGKMEAPNKSFKIDHPLDPRQMFLKHSVIESPERLNFYDGVAVLDGNGETVIRLPDYFDALNRDFRYQFEPLGAPAPDLYLKQPIKNNRFVIAGGPPFTKISWQVTGIRNDAWARANPLQVEENK